MVRKKEDRPVTLDEIKSHLHILSNDFDQSLERALNASVDKAEAYTGMCLWKMKDSISAPFSKNKNLDLPSNCLVDSVLVDGVEVEFYYYQGVLVVDADSGKKMVINYSGGYNSEDCPADIKMAFLESAAKFFNNPVDTVQNLPTTSTCLLHPYKRYKV